jgi:hypothetical protein
MAARIITNAAVGAVDWTNEIESKNIGKKGDYNMNFSNMYNTAKPVIQAGSSVDIDGQIYIFDINENISGSIGSGVYYVIISTAGNASFINTPPIDYDHEKNGYYTAGGSRYVLGFDGTGSLYSDKYNIERSYFDTPVIVKSPYFKIERTINAQNTTIDHEDGVSNFRSNNPVSVTYSRFRWYQSNDSNEREIMQISSNGFLMVDTLVDNGIDVAQFGANKDISASIGRGKLGYNGLADSFYMAHYDNMNSTDYGIAFFPLGTNINTKTGSEVRIRVNNSNVATFSGSAISLLKPVTINSGLSVPVFGSALSMDYISALGTGYIASVGNITHVIDSNNNTTDATFNIVKDTYNGTNLFQLNEAGRAILGGGIDDGLNVIQTPGSIYAGGGATFGDTVLVNTGLDNGVDKLQVLGSIYASDGADFDDTVKWLFFHEQSLANSDLVWDEISNWVPNIGDFMPCHGFAGDAAVDGGKHGVVLSIYRNAIDQISITLAANVGGGNVPNGFQTSILTENAGQINWTIQIMSNFFKTNI